MAIITKHIVKPAEATWKGRMCLSELDQTGFTTHVPNLYIYNNSTTQTKNKKQILDTLKNSLSRVLVPYYPLAGRLHWVGNSKGGRVELDCNAMGVELIEAESIIRVSDFGDFSSFYQTMFNGLIPGVDYINTPLSEIPILLIQLTWFKCGGIGLAMAVSHFISDATGVFQFYRDFAKLARGDVKLSSLDDLPYIDRGVLIAGRDDDHKDDDVHHFSRLPTLLGSNRRIDLEQRDYKEAVSQKLVLSKVQVDTLMNVAKLNHGNCTSQYTRVEVIVSHIWRCATKARDLQGDQMTALCLLFDSRTRLNPPLPPRYLGDAVIIAVEAIKASELVSKPLSYVCQKIRDRKEKIDDKYVRSTINFFQQQDSSSLFKYRKRAAYGGPEGFFLGNPNLSVSSMLNINTRGLDFGWGTEIYTGTPAQHHDGDVIIWPGHDQNDGSILVSIGLQGNHMERFKRFFYQDIEEAQLDALMFFKATAKY